MEAFNSLSKSEKLKLQQEDKPQQQLHHSQPQKPLQQQNSTLKVKSELESDLEIDPNNSIEFEDIEKALPSKTIDKVEAEKLPEILLKRVFPQTQLTVPKSTPKTVTASVFKTIPAGIKLPKTHGLSNATLIGGTRAPQSVTASLIQPIASIKRDASIGVKRLPSGRQIIAEPSIVPRQTVVTASLFQPRANVINATKANGNTTNGVNTMNKSYLMFNDMRPPTCEYLFFVVHSF